MFGVFDLPRTSLGFHRVGRYDKHDCVRLIDQPAEPIFPFLSGGNVVAINERGEANELEPPTNSSTNSLLSRREYEMTP